MVKINMMPFIIVAGVICFLQGCIEKHNTYGTACIIAESEGISQYENPTYKKTNYSTSYWLKLYETATGKLNKKIKLLDKNTVSPDVECFGIYNNAVWIYANGIKAFDINTLKQKANEEKIAHFNGMKKTIFPSESRMITAIIENGYIDFITDNGDKYRLTLADEKIINKQKLQSDKNNGEKPYRLLHPDSYGLRCDTLNNKMYILAKDSNAAKNANPYITELNETAYRMKFFTAGYAARKLGMHNTYEIEKINSPGEATYLNGCFAKNTYTGNIIRLSNPAGYLIIHNDVMGEKSKAIITRIDTNGKKIWETYTSVSPKIESCIMKGKFLAFTTNKAYMLSPHIGKDVLCFIDTENGSFTKTLLNE
jgi:hypothetical protein